RKSPLPSAPRSSERQSQIIPAPPWPENGNCRGTCSSPFPPILASCRRPPGARPRGLWLPRMGLVMPGWLPSPRRALLVGSAAGLLLALGAAVGTTYFGQNWHELIPGRVYRCAQLDPDQLRRAVEQYGIRTVLNLRGCSPASDWYLGESRATHDLDVSQE